MHTKMYHSNWAKRQLLIMAVLSVPYHYCYPYQNLVFHLASFAIPCIGGISVSTLKTLFIA